jgi:hypothetical protein
MFDLDPEETATTVRSLETSRSEPELVKLREGILQAVSRIIEIWGHDIEIASVSLITPLLEFSFLIPFPLTYLGDQCVHEGFDSIAVNFDFAVSAHRSTAVLDRYSSAAKLLVNMAEYCSHFDLANGTCRRNTA